LFTVSRKTKWTTSTKKELAALKKLAATLLGYDAATLAQTVSARVMDKRTMRDFGELCLTPVRSLKPKEIRALLLREGASQAVFARYLNVTTGLVSQWERGEKRPQGSSLMLSLVAKNGLQAVA
jgi:putative transcriptional regulator